MPNTDEIRDRLERRLRTLGARLDEMQQTLRQPEDDDLAEQAMELDDDQVLERLALAGHAEAALIRAALERLDAGTFGKCGVCGKPIAARRLEALPEATTCLRCAQEPS